MSEPPPRLTIQRLMLAIAGLAVCLWMALSPWSLEHNLVTSLLLGGASWWFTRRRPHAAARGLAITGGAVNLAFFLIFALHPYLRYDFCMKASLGSLMMLPAVAGFGFAWTVSRTGHGTRLRSALLVAVLIASPLVMLQTHWPLRLGFYLAAPTLNRIADRVESGRGMTASVWAGPYRVKAASPFASPPQVLLIVSGGPWTGEAGFFRSSTLIEGAHNDRTELMGVAGSKRGRWWYYAGR